MKPLASNKNFISARVQKPSERSELTLCSLNVKCPQTHCTYLGLQSIELHLRVKSITLQDHFFIELQQALPSFARVFPFLSKELRARSATWSAKSAKYPLVFAQLWYQQKGWGFWERSWDWHCPRHCMRITFCQCVACLQLSESSLTSFYLTKNLQPSTYFSSKLHFSQLQLKSYSVWQVEDWRSWSEVLSVHITEKK